MLETMITSILQTGFEEVTFSRSGLGFESRSVFKVMLINCHLPCFVFKEDKLTPTAQHLAFLL